jgi:beta-glucanase (GH16 family)
MMPANNNYSTNPWPGCGELDIMEEVGYNPNVIYSTIHCNKYNNGGTAIESGNKKIDTAESDFHVYAMKWTSSEIIFYVDGQTILTYRNDGSGANAWPFNTPFYVILNLAFGGNWGGAQGVDYSALPLTMEVDYVRVFQQQ